MGVGEDGAVVQQALDPARVFASEAVQIIVAELVDGKVDDQLRLMLGRRGQAGGQQ
jgi:hypothetical protein